MTIYIDEVLFLNFFFDFLLLFSVQILLKRNVKIFRIVLGAFVGSLTILVLFFKISSLQLFFIKLYLSILMILITFGYRNLKTFLVNIVMFYIVSIFLGGFLYVLNIEFAYRHKGILFYNNGISINFIFLIIVSPLVLYFYVKQNIMYKKKIVNTYKVNIYIGRRVLNLNGYLDTGNTLTFKGKPVIITNIKNTFKNKKMYIPYTSVGASGILEGIKVRRVEVVGIGMFENIYLAFNENINMDVLLNGLMEG